MSNIKTIGKKTRELNVQMYPEVFFSIKSLEVRNLLRKTKYQLWANGQILLRKCDNLLKGGRYAKYIGRWVFLLYLIILKNLVYSKFFLKSKWKMNNAIVGIAFYTDFWIDVFLNFSTKNICKNGKKIIQEDLVRFG